MEMEIWISLSLGRAMPYRSSRPLVQVLLLSMIAERVRRDALERAHGGRCKMHETVHPTRAAVIMSWRCHHSANLARGPSARRVDDITSKGTPTFTLDMPQQRCWMRDLLMRTNNSSY